MSGFMATPVATSITYIVGGTPQTTFVVPFPFDDIEDLVVSVAGAVTTAFTLSGTTEVDGFFTAANVVLTTPAQNASVNITRRTVLEQEVRFPIAGKFSVQALNAEISRLWMASQDRRGETENAIRVTPGEAPLTDLPPRAERALRYVAFDAAGDVIAAAPGATSVVSSFMATVLDDLDATAAQTTLGGTAVGRGVFTAANTTAGQTALGGTTVGRGVFSAADATAGQTALGGTTVGRAVFAAADAAAARTAIGATTTGNALITAADAAAARTAVGATTVGSAVVTAVDAAAGRSAIGAAPLPQSAAGVGEIAFINPGAATNYTLPAGGTWLTFAGQFNTTNGAYAFTHSFQIRAGGSSLGAPASPFAWVGWAWRIT